MIFRRFCSFAVALSVAGLAAGAHAESAASENTERMAQPVTTAAPVDPATASDNGRVRTLYREGAAQFRAGNALRARELLLQAWAVRRTYDVAAALGQVESDLKLYRDATEHLDFAIRNFAPIESEETLEHVKAGFAAARPHVASMTITDAPEGAQILVDGAIVGASPLASPLFLEPGGHVVEARAGKLAAKSSVFVEANTEQTLALRVTDASSPAPQGAPKPAKTPTDMATSERSIVPLIVGGAAFVVGATMGIGFRVAASNDADRVSALRAQIGKDPTACSRGAAASCSALREAADSEHKSETLSTIGLIVAGAAAIATPAYWLLSAGDSAKEPAARSSALRVGGTMDRTGAAVTVLGTF